jgi:hypothetical protein
MGSAMLPTYLRALLRDGERGVVGADIVDGDAGRAEVERVRDARVEDRVVRPSFAIVETSTSSSWTSTGAPWPGPVPLPA